MRSIKYILLFLLFGLESLSIQVLSQDISNANPEQIQKIVHLLDYISRDYSAAVEGGKVINDLEYAEMLEFESIVSNSLTQVTNKEELLSQQIKLRNNIIHKLDKDSVAATAIALKNQIIELTGFITSPTVWPNLATGKKLYLENCQSCHGSLGDGNGKLAKGMVPAPANFLDDDLMLLTSPFNAYNTIKLGVPGTSMVPIQNLSEKEVWDIAFYIKSMRFEGRFQDSTERQKQFQLASSQVSLSKTAISSDQELLNFLEGSSISKTSQLAALRLNSSQINASASLNFATTNLHKSLEAYKAGLVEESRQFALAAYLDGIEPVEGQLRALDVDFSLELEKGMMELRRSIEKKESFELVEKRVKTALNLVLDAEELLINKGISFKLAFILTLSILLREGLEAFLIIAIIISLLRSANLKKAQIWLHGGWITAVLLGFAGWFLSEWLLNISGKNRELFEGILTLFAVVVLVIVGFWLHSKSVASQWKIFVEEKIKSLINTENMLGLFLFSFMVVFREAIESVLFLQAIRMQTASTDHTAIGLGLITSFAVIFVLMMIFLKYSKRIPIQLLFRYSSWMIIVLAIILIGKGIHSLQEMGMISFTPIYSSIRVAWLGIYPSIESCLSQLVLLGLILFFWRRGKKQK